MAQEIALTRSDRRAVELAGEKRGQLHQHAVELEHQAKEILARARAEHVEAEGSYRSALDDVLSTHGLAFDKDAPLPEVVFEQGRPAKLILASKTEKPDPKPDSSKIEAKPST